MTSPRLSALIGMLLQKKMDFCSVSVSSFISLKCQRNVRVGLCVFVCLCSCVGQTRFTRDCCSLFKDQAKSCPVFSIMCILYTYQPLISCCLIFTLPELGAWPGLFHFVSDNGICISFSMSNA